MFTIALLYVVGLLALLALAAWALRSHRGSGGFVITNGRPAVWNRKQLPIGVIFDGHVTLPWVATVRGACTRFNLAMGQQHSLFIVRQHFQGDRTGTLTVAEGAAAGDDIDYSLTLEDGIIIRASLTVPSSRNGGGRMALAVHGLGHILGLAHDPNRKSFMYAYVPGQTSPGIISHEDAVKLRRQYGR